MSTRKLWFGFIAILLSLGSFSWIEHRVHIVLEENLSTWVNRDITIDTVSLGLFESEIKGLVVPGENINTFTNDVEIGCIQTEYMPLTFVEDINTLTRVKVDNLTIHWQGLGKNIYHMIGNIKDHVPKSRQLKKVESPSTPTLSINELLISNATIITHIGHNAEVIKLPDLTLNNINGTHQHILKEIVGQIGTKMKQDQAK